ncbi:MAG TPA: serine/threonine-protein kinase [Myxococcaceae bacterium]|nr:serine/threonine-protein kinase [Myxococcaceae bacterium]
METPLTAAGCPDENTLVALLQGRLGESARAGVERHLDGCADCRRICAAMVRGEEPPTEPPTEPGGALSLGATPVRVVHADRPPLEPGTQVGRYVIEEKLGQGGMGVVYAAYDPSLARRVSLKLILSAEGEEVVDSKARLQREAQALARLHHPNVVAVHDLGAWDSQIYVVMELVRGTTLRHWLHAQERPWREIIRVFLDAGAGLAAAHRAGLIHRDFKPSNVLVDEEGRARVLDFGLARIAGALPSTADGAGGPDDAGDDDVEEEPTSNVLTEALTRTGHLVGTPLYMAPEQHRGGTLDERTDQFSFFVSLYEALFGTRPYLVRDLQAHALEGKPAPLRAGSKGADVPARVRQVVLRGLSVDPAARFKSMGEAQAALRAAGQGRTRRLVIAGAAAGALLVLGGGAVIARGRYGCEREGRALSGDWNAGHGAAIRAAFLATQAPYAASAADHVTKRLDAYADEWRGAAVDACAAARAAGKAGNDLWGRRKDCLARLRMQVGSLVDVLEHADRSAVERSVQATYGLERVSSCASPEAFQAFRAPSEAGAYELRERAAKVRALLAAGQVKAGLALAEPLARDAARGESRASLAEALELLGALRKAQGDAKGAEEALFRAVTAAQSAGDEIGGARVMAQLASVVGKGERAAEGRRWVELALAVVERDGPAPDLEAQILDAKAWIDYDERKIDAAIATAAQAVDLREKALPADHPDVARAYLTWGTMLNGSGHPARAEEAYRKALPVLQRALGPEHPQIASALHGIGTMCKHQGRYREALEWLQKAYGMRSRVLGPESPEVAATLNNIGTAEMGLGLYRDALEHEMKALVIIERSLGPDHANVAITLNNVAAARARLGEGAAAEGLMRRAMEIAVKRYGPEHDLVSTCWLNLGLAQQAEGQLPAAVESLQKSADLLEQKLGRDHPAMFVPLQALGGAELRAMRPQDAVETLRRALAVVEKEAGAAKLAEARMDLAKALRATGKTGPEARELAMQAEQGFRDSERTSDADASAALARELAMPAPPAR